MDDFDISVIIPCRNEVGTVENLLDDMARQTIMPREVLVVDSASTDDLAGSVAAYRDKLPVRVIRTDTPGLAQARNTGSAQAIATYLLFVDADTRLTPDFLAKVRDDVAATRAEVAAILETVQERSPFARFGVRLFNFYIRLMSHTPWPIMCSCFLATREVNTTLKGFDTDIYIMEDYDFALRARRRGARFRVLPHPRHIVSMRRWQGTSGLVLILRGIYGELYRYTHGLRITKQIYQYEMGGQASSQKASSPTKPPRK